MRFLKGTLLLAILGALFALAGPFEERTRLQQDQSVAAPQAASSQLETAAEAVTMLTLPAKLDTLKGDRAANQRLGKACYWLHVSGDPEEVIEAAIADTPRGRLVKESLRRNLKILHGLGCLGEENLAKLRRGRSPIITRGPYAGEPAEVDHIVPVAVAPEFGNWIGNLEFMPRTLNRRKGAKMGERQWSHYRKLIDAAANVKR